MKESWAKDIVISRNSDLAAHMSCEIVSLLKVWKNWGYVDVLLGERLVLVWYGTVRYGEENIKDLTLGGTMPMSVCLSSLMSYEMMLHDLLKNCVTEKVAKSFS